MSNKYWINKHGERFALKDYNPAYWAISVEPMIYSQFGYLYQNTTHIGDKAYIKEAENAIRSSVATGIMYNILSK